MAGGGEFPTLDLPVRPPYAPMEARPAKALPAAGPWRYEPKWDGFRCLVFRQGAAVALQSKAGRPLGRYFPEVVAAVAALPLDGVVLDGELVVPVPGDPAGALSFDALQARVHPAASRVARLAAETPARLLVFDLLVEAGRPLVEAPLDARRAALEALAARALPAGGALAAGGPCALSPSTLDREAAARWLADGPATDADGVVAKRRELPYRAGLRDGMVKVKRLRTVDCVVGGWRRGAGGAVGSLLLGLYDAAGRLHHVGHTSGLPRAERAALTARLEALRVDPAESFTGRAPGGPSRWRDAADAAWEPVRPTLVVEVRHDLWSGGRFRHGTTLVRWRTDKDPRACTLAQVEGGACRPADGGPE